MPSPNKSHCNHSEPNDLDTIYKVLKKAGEMSAAAEKSQTGNVSQPTMDIPIVNVPDYPDRTPRRGPPTLKGPLSQQQRQGLTAPTIADVSSSGPKTQQISLTHKLMSLKFLPLLMIKQQKTFFLNLFEILHHTNHKPSLLKFHFLL